MSCLLVPPDAMAARKLRTALDEMCAEDPTLGVTIGPVNEILLQGVSELHLEIAVDILKRRKGLVLQVGAPQVHYPECITKTIEWEYTHKRQSGGWSEYANEHAKVRIHFEPTGARGEYAKVSIRIEPTEPGSGFQFENAVRYGAIPAAFIPAIERA
jgi:elongation factor G